MKKVAVIFLGSFLVLVGTAKFAISDIVILKDGRQIEGIVEEQTDKVIKFRIKIGELKFVPSEIDSVIIASEKDNAVLEESWKKPEKIVPVPAQNKEEPPLQKEESVQVSPAPDVVPEVEKATSLEPSPEKAIVLEVEKPVEVGEISPVTPELDGGITGDTLPEPPAVVLELPTTTYAEKSSGPENAPTKVSPEGAIPDIELPGLPKPEAISIKWMTDYDNGMISASQNEMPIVIDFYADWCNWCQKLDYEVYASPEVIDAGGSSFTWIKVNVDDKKDLVAKYNVERYPTVIFLNSDGKELDRIRGFVDADTFLNKMKEVLAKK